MKLNFLFNKQAHMKGIFVDINKEEALRLAVSIIEQVRTNNPNAHRAEFYPIESRGYNYFTIGVKPEPRPPNLTEIVLSIQDEIFEIIPEGDTPHKRGIKKGIYKALQIVHSKLWGIK